MTHAVVASSLHGQTYIFESGKHKQKLLLLLCSGHTDYTLVDLEFRDRLLLCVY